MKGILNKLIIMAFSVLVFINEIDYKEILVPVLVVTAITCFFEYIKNKKIKCMLLSFIILLSMNIRGERLSRS